MKQWWETLAVRVDALSLRERLFLFVSILACVMALADVVWLTPAQQAHRKSTQRFENQALELKRLTGLVGAPEASLSADRAGQAQRDEVTQQIQSVNQQVQTLLPEVSETAPLAQAMVHLLRRHDGLTLLHTKTVASDESAAPASRGAPAQSGASGLARQGVELSVSGPYAELIRYVQALEKSLPQARWGVLRISSDKAPPELTLQLFLLELKP